MTAHAMRKLLPPAQCVVLSNYTLKEALRYRPGTDGPQAVRAGEPLPTLDDLLQPCCINLELPQNPVPGSQSDKTRVESPRRLAPIKTLRDFLLAGSPHSSSPDLWLGRASGGMGYGAITVLSGTPREVADVWLTLRAFLAKVKTPTDLNNDAILGYVRDWFLDALDKDANLTHRDRTRLKESVRDRPGGGVELEPFSGLQVKWAVSRGVTLTLGETEKPPLRGAKKSLVKTSSEEPPREFIFQRYRGRKFSLLAPEAATPSEAMSLEKRREVGLRWPLEPRNEACFTLLHDLVALSPARAIGGPWLIPSVEELGLATVQWKLGRERFSIPWLRAVLRSFWELDRFCDAWNGTLNAFTNAFEPKARCSEEAIQSLAGHWIAANVATLLGEEPVDVGLSSDDATGGSERWAGLVRRVESLIGSARYGRWRRERSLVHLAVLLCPESGIPTAFAQPFWRSKELRGYWYGEAKEIRFRREWQFLAARNDQQVPDEVLLLISPVRYFERLRDRVDRQLKRLSQNPRSEPARGIPHEFYQRFTLLWTRIRQTQEPFQEELGALIQETRPRVGFDEESDESSLDPSLDGSGWQEIRQDLLNLRQFAEFGRQMLDHPANEFENGVLCPSESEIRSRGSGFRV